MEVIKKDNPPTITDVDNFLSNIEFILPDGFITFFREAKEAQLYSESIGYVILWPLSEMVRLNRDYNVNEYAPSFFIFGSDGGDMAYCIQKKSGHIFDIPFVGMADEEAVFRFNSFTELLNQT